MFFFSSRRRHTRLQGDWSSDVCSSDLANPERTRRPSRQCRPRRRLWSRGRRHHGGGNYHFRSEERRVGEESGSRWWPGNLKKKKEKKKAIVRCATKFIRVVREEAELAQ